MPDPYHDLLAWVARCHKALQDDVESNLGDAQARRRWAEETDASLTKLYRELIL